MNNFLPAVVVVAFSRPEALRRSLRAIDNAKYSDDVTLIISIDGGASPEVHSVADEFIFSSGEKVVLKHSDNLGLKNHILKCGDLSERYGSVIILEDDIVVDSHFYSYAQDALNFYKGEESVAGVSLYAPEYNEYAGLPFSPIFSEYDTYFMQIPSSWGEAWSFDHWSGFRQWLLSYDEEELQSTILLPNYVKAWKSSSWKKLFAFYLCSLDKYFVFPYRSLATNVSDPGGFHNVNGSNIVQVHMGLQTRAYRELEFPLFTNSSVSYDSFMENTSHDFIGEIKNNIGIDGGLTLDLYGLKPVGNISCYEYCITVRKPESYIHSFACSFRPVEMNLLQKSINGQRGSCFYLFSPKCNLSLKNGCRLELLFYWAGFDFLSKKYLTSLLFGVFEKIRRRF